MTSKVQRRDVIARIVRTQGIRSQEELQTQLASHGIHVTQATLSRDLHDMGVFKGPGGYVLPALASAPVAPVDNETTLRRTLRREVRSIDHSGNIVLLRTDAGHANALAVELDRARPLEVLGTLAGDDTVFVVLKRAQSAGRFVRKLKSAASLS